MVIACGFAEDGKRGRKPWSIERRALRRLKHVGERMSRKLATTLGRLSRLDDLTRMRVRSALWGLFGGNSPPPPLLPA